MAQNPDPAATAADAARLDTAAPAPEPRFRFGQRWTCADYSGGRDYPLVDNQYQDGSTGQVKTYINPGLTSPGPPSIEVYWGSRCRPSGEADEFRGGTKTSTLTVTEYVLGVAACLKESDYELHSLTATKYTINIFISANMSTAVVHRLWLKYGL